MTATRRSPRLFSHGPYGIPITSHDHRGEDVALPSNGGEVICLVCVASDDLDPEVIIAASVDCTEDDPTPDIAMAVFLHGPVEKSEPAVWLNFTIEQARGLAQALLKSAEWAEAQTHELPDGWHDEQ